ncbi:MAG: DUF3878 family protein [Oscillospiraceae bacterium]|nr:DUF3878 family protein [Oscillospiraceae bacterium]
MNAETGMDLQELNSLSEDVQLLLAELENNALITRLLPSGQDLLLVMADNAAYRHTLILKNIEQCPSLPENTVIRDFSLTHEDQRYQLCFRTQDSDAAVALSCTGFDTEFLHFNAMGGAAQWQTPWEYLVSTAAALRPKIVLFPERCNAQEQALLPLLTELTYLPPYNASAATGAAAFPCLKEIAGKAGCKTVVKRLEKLEKQALPGKRFRSLAEKLTARLNKLRQEPIWRNVYGRLLESQEEYPGKAEVVCPPALLEATRSQIWQRMEQYGYGGSYPAFRRKKFLPGLHLEESYGLLYWAGMKRKTRFRIQCFETVENNVPVIRFVTGTALLKGRQSAKDIFACLFNAKGRRFSSSTTYPLPLSEDAPDAALAQHIKAAVKKAALRPLSGKEKKAIGQKNKAGFGAFMKSFAMAGLFALVLVGLVALGSFAAMYFVDGAENAKSFVLQFPWWIFFVGAWLIYGIPTAACTVAAKNK